MALVFTINKSKSGIRSIVIAGACIVLAGYSTVTFFYNNVNRQAMMANKQKWEAMDVLVSYIRTEQPELITKNFYAPDFWTSTGVSSIPGDSPFNGVNYWTLYAHRVLGQQLTFLKDDPGFTINVVGLKYLSTPNGVPIIFLEELTAEQKIKRTAVAPQPISGIIIDQRNSLPIKSIESKDWKCNVFCSMVFENDVYLPRMETSFKSSNLGPKSLIAQFFMSRESGYGNPIGIVDIVLALKVENWGPRETVLGVVPNLQPDGGAGIWIKLENQDIFNNLQVIIDGQPAKKTQLSPGLITASLPPSLFNKSGKKKVSILNIKNGKSVIVGDFLVNEK